MKRQEKKFHGVSQFHFLLMAGLAMLAVAACVIEGAQKKKELLTQRAQYEEQLVLAERRAEFLRAELDEVLIDKRVVEETVTSLEHRLKEGWALEVARARKEAVRRLRFEKARLFCEELMKHVEVVGQCPAEQVEDRDELVKEVAWHMAYDTLDQLIARTRLKGYGPFAGNASARVQLLCQIIAVDKGRVAGLSDMELAGFKGSIQIESGWNPSAEVAKTSPRFQEMFGENGPQGLGQIKPDLLPNLDCEVNASQLKSAGPNLVASLALWKYHRTHVRERWSAGDPLECQVAYNTMWSYKFYHDGEFRDYDGKEIGLKRVVPQAMAYYELLQQWRTSEAVLAHIEHDPT